MFYCEKCRKKNEWPEAISLSYGPCEMCGRTKECWDRPSYSLPPAKEKK